MTSPGTETLAAIESMRRLFEEVSKLLGTADSMMAAKGWKPRAANTVIASTSAALYAPRKWLPHNIFRFYQHKSKVNLLGCISVLIGVDSEDDDAVQLREPLVCGLVLDYGEGIPVPSDWKYEYAAWHLNIPSRVDDGTLLDVPVNTVKGSEGCSAIRLRSLAVPLVEITGSEALIRRVVEPIATTSQV